MTEPFARLRRFLRELKRRNVYKVAVAYLAVAFIGLQAARLLVPATTLPGWADELLIYVAVFGFPIALVVAWAFEMTPEGVRRTETPEGEPKTGALYQWIGLAVVVLLAGGVWYATAGEGGEPAPETTATRDTSAARTASTARDTAGPPRIAVLPFENIARDTGDAFFAQGMHEEVLNQLSKISGLEVISRTSVMQYAETNKTVGEISEELGGVNALLEGTVRRAGDQIRITTQLIKAPEDEHLWSNTYDRTLSVEEIFDIQADIAEQIARALETRLTEGEHRRIESAPTEDLAAYETFLHGRGEVWRFWGQWSPELLDRASRSLREAIRRDSSFAEAHAWLGYAHVGRIWNRPAEEAPRWLDSATAAVERARRIDPDRGSVHLAQAAIYRFQGSMDAEAEALRNVLDRQPGHSLAKSELARNLSRRGRYAEAVRVARGAVRLDPRRPVVLVGMGDRLRAVGWYDAAKAWYRHTLEIEPGFASAYAGMAFSELEQGEPDRALAIWEDSVKQAGAPVVGHFAMVTALAADRPERARAYQKANLQEVNSTPYPAPGSDPLVGWSGEALSPGDAIQIGFIEVRLGHKELGRQLVRKAVEALRGETHRGERLGRPYGVWLAGGLAVLGRTEEALQEVERVAEEGPGRSWLPWYPLLDSLRSNAQFQQILHGWMSRRQEAREEVRRMNLDLYPPGAEPDTATQKPQSDD